MKQFVTLAAVSLLLAGCKDEPAAPGPENEAQSAEGEVLGGTISDDMLPLGHVTSQAPPLRESETGSTGSEDEDTSASETATTEAAEPEVAEPEAAAGPQAEPEQSAEED